MLHPPRSSLQAAVSLACAVLATAAQATQVSRTGQFIDDDEVRSFAVQFSAAALFTARTWSYAGGANAAGEAIAAGGFAPVLTLADDAGEVLFTGAGSATNSVCSMPGVPAPADGVFCWDTGFSSHLDAGSYRLYLSQDGNAPAGSNVLIDGFSRTGSTDFTALDFLGLSGTGLRFVQADGSQRDGHWAVDFTAQAVPEPATWAALSAGLLLLRTLAGRRRRQSKSRNPL